MEMKSLRKDLKILNDYLKMNLSDENKISDDMKQDVMIF